ncbi:DUF4199 domain-containing protein [Aquimarina macrocephali]|uniref:DUF4199 domain-containing protein n=1 Tax=Aquimarina macrocephali TaxID=666563 RepID=UPI003F66FEFD
MEETTISTKKNILNYGLILGLTWVVYGLIRHITDNRTSTSWGIVIIELFIHVTIIVYGIYTYKRANNGFLKLSQALKIGLGVALIATIIYVIWDIFLLKIISPETMYELIKSSNQLSENESINEDTIMSRESNFLFTTSLASIIFYSILGGLISLLGGAIMQKNRDTF